MYCPPGHAVLSFRDSIRASTWRVPRLVFRWRSRVVAVLLVLLMAGCSYPIASEEVVDVCALTRDAVTAVLKDAQISKPSQGVCLFRTKETSAVRGSIQIVLYTRASVGYSEGLDQMLGIIRAEAEQANGSPGLNEFGDLPKDAVAVAFGINPPDYINQVVVTERGVLMELSISGESILSHEELAALTGELWMRVANYEPAKDATKDATKGGGVGQP